MPPKRQAIGLSIPQERKQNVLRVLETDEQCEVNWKLIDHVLLGLDQRCPTKIQVEPY